MKTNVLLMLLAGLLVSLNACAFNFSKTVYGNGEVTKKVREVGPFDAISASSGINVYLFQGDEEKVVVETDDNLQECIETRLEGRTLHCYINCTIRKSKKTNVYVNYKTIGKIKASSGSDVYGETVVKTEKLDVHVSSGADVKLDVEVNHLSGSVSSGSDLVLKGTAGEFYGDASSGADIKADELQAKTCWLKASSAGDIKVRVSEKIDADASSGGDIIFYGNPSFVDINESSGGDVTQRR